MADAYPLTTFNGTISRAGEHVPVTFIAYAGTDVRLQIMLDSVPMKTAKPLWGCFGQPGEENKSFCLEGTSADGQKFYSDTVEVISWQHKDGLELGVLLRRAAITVPLQKPAPRPLLRFWTRSFRSFSNPAVDTPLGLLHVWGTEKDVPNDNIAGSISLQGPPNIPADWANRADAFVKFMWCCLAFAHGGRLQSPLTQLYIGTSAVNTFYDGTASIAELPVVPFLDHGPFIKAVCARFFAPEAFPDVIWTIVGWMQLDTNADAARFLSAMTAIEAVVENLTPKTKTTVVPKSEFSGLCDQMVATIEGSTLPSEAKLILVSKSKGLNGRSLSQKIEALRDHYGFSPEKYPHDGIVALIKQRNAVVHSGVGNNEEIWQHILFARELIADIVFYEIGYNGVRQSYLDGYKIVHPDKGQVDDPEGADVNLS